MTWIPISVPLPSDHEGEYLVTDGERHSYGWPAEDGTWMVERSMMQKTIDPNHPARYEQRKITHYMPIPPLPKNWPSPSIEVLGLYNVQCLVARSHPGFRVSLKADWPSASIELLSGMITSSVDRFGYINIECEYDAELKFIIEDTKDEDIAPVRVSLIPRELWEKSTSNS